MKNEHNEPKPLLGPEVGHWHKEDVLKLIAGTSFTIAFIVALAWLLATL
jgi:Zn-dependent protease with chaperone function